MPESTGRVMYTIAATLGAICLTLFIWAGPSCEAGSPDLHREQGTSSCSLAAEIVGLPNFIYVGEQRNFSVRVTNDSDTVQHVAVTFECNGDRLVSRLVVEGDSSSAVVLGLTVSEDDMDGQVVLTVRAEGAAQVLWRESFRLRRVLGNLADLKVRNGGYYGPDGSRIVLVNAYENEDDYRRWAIPKWVAGLCRGGASRKLLWIQPELLHWPASRTGTQIALDLSIIAHDGSPVDSLLRVDEVVPEIGTATLVIAWGYKEAFERRPPGDLARAVDATIDRARQRNASCRILVATPPPIVGEEPVCETYAEALRDIALQHHASVIDLYNKMISLPEWESLYSLDGDPTVFGLFPSEEGKAKILQWIEEALK